MLDLKYKTILGVAVPLMVSSFIQSIVLLTDAAFISRYDTSAFDAVGNGGLLYVTLFMALAGMGDGAQILIARRIGQKHEYAISSIFSTSICIHLVFAIVLFLIAQFLIPLALNSFVRHKDLAELQNEFLHIRSHALFFAMITLTIQAFVIAQGKTWVVFISALLTAGSNILLDWLLIFGKFGLPELGLKGAALASTIADGMGMLFLLFFMFIGGDARRYKLLSHFTFKREAFSELLNVGIPLALQGIAALGTWTIFFIWIEQIGKFELTVSQNVRSIYFLVFVPIWGFSGTTKTYISQYIGAKKNNELPIIRRRIQLLTLCFLFLFFHGALFYPEQLIRFLNPSDLHVEKSAEILRFISISIFIFGFISVYVQTISGSGNTGVNLLIETTCVVIYICAAYLFIKVWHWDILWIWSVEYVYFISMGVLSIGYLNLFDWKKKEI
jgi:MATE family multidrug resistance protein